MTENLLTPSVIKLFGRLMNDLQFKFDPNTVFRGYNNLLERQLYGGGVTGPINIAGTAHLSSPIIDGLANTTGLLRGMSVTIIDGHNNPMVGPGAEIMSIGPGNQIALNVITLAQQDTNVTGTATAMLPNFARIYGFSFEGAYYQLPRPSIFLVHGGGQPVGNWAYPSTVEGSGVAAREWDFSGLTGPIGANPPPPNPADLWYWEYEKSDFSIRLDPEAGPFEQILLAAALRSGADMADRSGQGLGIRSGQGLEARSGQGLDIRSGQGLRR
jgi:hypothetical protein